MPTVNIQFTLFSAFYAPLIVTMAGNFLADEGIDFNWSVAPPGESAIKALLDGKADVIQSAPSQGFSSLKKGDEPRAVHFAQVNEMDGFFITAHEPDESFNWKKLEGSEVIVFKAGQPNVMFRRACQAAGIDYDKINIVTPGGADAMDKAFRSGQGKYVQQQGPYPQQLEADGAGHIVAQCGPLIGPNAFSSLASTREWLASDDAKAFTLAYTKARAFINSQSADEITDIILPYFKDTSRAALLQCIDSYQKLGCWTPHAEITQKAFDNLLEIYTATGEIDQQYPYEKVCASLPA